MGKAVNIEKAKISIKDREPKIGDKILAYGFWRGEVSGREPEREWLFVSYVGGREGSVIGSDHYSAQCEDIKYWIEFKLIKNETI